MVEAGAFDGVTIHDGSIDLSSNLLKTLESNSFKDITAEHIYLHGMVIDHLPTNVFEGVSLSETLHLQDNQILYIDESPFNNIAVENV